MDKVLQAQGSESKDKGRKWGKKGEAITAEASTAQ